MNFRRTIVTVFAIAAATAAAARGQDAMATLVVQNVLIHDVTNGEPAASARSIFIAGDRIMAIVPPGNREIPRHAEVIDAAGRVCLPGLIDLHSHLLLHPYNETSWNDQVLTESLELRTIRGTVAARQTLESGWTSLRDLGTEGAAFADVGLRDAINQGIIPGPRLFVVTKAMVTTGGYGPLGFDPRFDLPLGAQTADGADDCRRVAREQIAAGADWIKVYADYRRRANDPATPTFSLEELQAIVDEASSAGISVSAHATTDEGIRRCIAAGVRTIEHGYQASDDVLAEMRLKNIVLCPTLAASEAMARYQGWDPDSGQTHPRIETARSLMRRAVNAGVTIACGSDVGVFPHGENTRELELMFAWGMPVADVLRSATVTAAQVLNRDDLGLVETGFLADLIIVDQDPTVSLQTLRQPVLVIKGGQVVVNRLNR